jgi:hypothetical protein
LVRRFQGRDKALSARNGRIDMLQSNAIRSSLCR